MCYDHEEAEGHRGTVAEWYEPVYETRKNALPETMRSFQRGLDSQSLD